MCISNTEREREKKRSAPAEGSWGCERYLRDGSHCPCSSPGTCTAQQLLHRYLSKEFPGQTETFGSCAGVPAQTCPVQCCPRGKRLCCWLQSKALGLCTSHRLALSIFSLIHLETKFGFCLLDWNIEMGHWQRKRKNSSFFFKTKNFGMF